MKKIITTFILLALLQAANAQERNNIGFDFFAGSYTKAPKNNLPGNNKNSFIRHSYGRIIGLYYERFLKNQTYSVQGGIYYHRLFQDIQASSEFAIKSVYIPVELNVNLLGKRNETALFLGYTIGLDFNFIGRHQGSGSDEISMYNKTAVYYWAMPRKHFYMSPHMGPNIGVNFWNLSFSFRYLFDFFVPEYVTFKTVYTNDQGKEVTEYNTNANSGMAFMFGFSYRF
ncbi:MAG: hypothetical protein JXR65_07635 [Bacteroidales bacterium]|nr:hypothetical protein [Bacteroidales bacterium]